MPRVNGFSAFSHFQCGFGPPVDLPRARSIMLGEYAGVYCMKNKKPCDNRHLFLAELKVFYLACRILNGSLTGLGWVGCMYSFTGYSN